MRNLITVMIYSADEAEQLTAEDLLIAWGTQSVIASRIAEEGYAVPPTLDSSIKNCKRELDHKLEADLERELQTIESRRSALATVQEKRDALDTRAEEIRKKLGRGVAKAAGSE